MSNLGVGLKRLPIPLILALAVVVGASVVVVLQINILPPPPAIVAPVDTPAAALTGGTHTVVFPIWAYAGQLVIHDNLAALGRVRLTANTTGWHFQLNDWIFTVMRRSTGNATFTVGGVTIDVFQYNSTHALVVNRQRNTAVITRIIQVGGTGWFAYHPVHTVYDSATVSGINRYLAFRGLSQVLVFQPLHDYIEFTPDNRVFRVFFDVVTPTQRTLRGTSLTNTTSFTPLAANAPVIVNGMHIVDINNVVLSPVWVIHVGRYTASIRTALTVAPEPVP